MSNPFDDLKEDDADPDEPQGTTTETESETKSEQSDDASSTAEKSKLERTDEESLTVETSSSRTNEETVTEPTGDRDQSDEAVSPAETGPAFEYSEVKQKPFYARTETVNEFENKIRTTIVPKLAEAGVLDEENREIHDAILRLANEEPERVAELVLEERRQSGSQ